MKRVRHMLGLVLLAFSLMTLQQPAAGASAMPCCDEARMAAMHAAMGHEPMDAGQHTPCDPMKGEQDLPDCCKDINHAVAATLSTESDTSMPLFRVDLKAEGVARLVAVMPTHHTPPPNA
ncbi:MAG: hypothetical protein EP335_19080 [Alphaproteobacteria bacterium]|nr:MAG: hypothetical protein EP335_19080 [Alphaproteobacteria bacterium]